MWTLGVTITLQYPPRKQCLNFFLLYPTYDEHFNYLSHTIILFSKNCDAIIKIPPFKPKVQSSILFLKFSFFLTNEYKKRCNLWATSSNKFPQEGKDVQLPQEIKGLA